MSIEEAIEVAIAKGREAIFASLESNGVDYDDCTDSVGCVYVDDPIGDKTHRIQIGIED